MNNKGVHFIDTCILMEILQVPKKMTSYNKEVLEEYEQLSSDANQTFVLPISVLIETGNHINHIKKNNSEKERCISQFLGILEAINQDEIPWKLINYKHQERLPHIIDHYKSHAKKGMGLGDVYILEEYNTYITEIPNLKGTRIRIWTLDKHLNGYDSVH